MKLSVRLLILDGKRLDMNNKDKPIFSVQMADALLAALEGESDE